VKCHEQYAETTGYAYETIANKPIFAGTAERAATETSIGSRVDSKGEPSLGALALGAGGLSLWRAGTVSLSEDKSKPAFHWWM
jgi:hypothetical protein